MVDEPAPLERGVLTAPVEVHSTLGQTPAAVWAAGTAKTRPITVTGETAFLVDFLPVIRRTLTAPGSSSITCGTSATRSSRGSPAVTASTGSCCAATRAT